MKSVMTDFMKKITAYMKYGVIAFPMERCKPELATPQLMGPALKNDYPEIESAARIS